MSKKIRIETGRTNFVGLAEYGGKCRHMVDGLVDYKMCAHNYNCLRCPFDQMVADEIVIWSDMQSTMAEAVGF